MWIEITVNDVSKGLMKPEILALKKVATVEGQNAVIEEVIDSVIAEVRGYVAACQQNTLGAGKTIPNELEDHALAIIRKRLIDRLGSGGEDMDTEGRKEAYRDAMRALRDVAACNLYVVCPDVPSSEAMPSIRPSIQSRKRLFTRRQQDGI